MTTNPLIQLHDHGQSFWLDNIRREWLTGGELARLVAERGLRGLTSNPAILHNAISGSRAYDAQLETLVRAGASTMTVYERLVISDLQGAADVLRPVYDGADGADGFVSLEVSPLLAHDTDGTVAQARRLFAEVDRPNVMIKVPGTPAGLAAIETLIADGIPINVTLLFSATHYAGAAEAYLRGLERRLEAGHGMAVASVASVFLSRIDGLVDTLLGHRIRPTARSAQDAAAPEALAGKAAVACAKVSYTRFKALFSGPRWERLAAAGARVQRPLWASTSTKNPLYSDVGYVEPLIGPHTVNTLPDATVAAFGDHGRVATTIADGAAEAQATLQALAAVGIDIDDVCQQLQDDGVGKFVAPFLKLLATLDKRRAAVLADVQVGHRFEAGSLGKNLAAVCAALDEVRASERLWARDATLWGQDDAANAAIANRLGWLGLPTEMEPKLDEIVAFAAEVRAEGIDTVVLLGMGGSSLTTDVAADVFGRRAGFPTVRVLDSTHPDAVHALTAELDLERALFIVASKSGGTLETSSLFRHFAALYDQRTGSTGSHFIAITDAGTSLVRMAAEQGFRRVFVNPTDVGGRFSALSYFGLVPMALAGIDVRAVLRRAREMAERCAPSIAVADNPGLKLGAFLAVAHAAGRVELSLVTSPRLGKLGDWLEQLIAESTGKHGLGILPVVREPLGIGEVDVSRRAFAFLRFADEVAAQAEALAAVEAAGHPVYAMTLPDPHDLGQAFFCWELATASCGVVMGINPFDEPDVRSAKVAANALLEQVTASGALPAPRGPRSWEGIAMELDPATGRRLQGDVPDALAVLFGEAQAAGRYVAIMAYVPMTAPIEAALGRLRATIARRWRLTTTVGFGPRLLHSIGQLYKGGANRGTFLQLVDAANRLVSIPGQRYDFGILVSAQAQGDFQALCDGGRTAARLEVEGDVCAAIDRLTAALGA